jgi:hypothetical protein
MAVPWLEAVRAALRRCSTRHNSRLVSRSDLINEELPQVVTDTASSGATPHQTLSRILQKIRDLGELEFIGPGMYLLLDQPIDVEQEELSQEALDLAIQRNCLRLGAVATSDQICLLRRRKGQERLRRLALLNYRERCSVCDVAEPVLLVASHVIRWADAVEHRGKLSNVLCLCRFHDVLFEQGYWSLTDDYRLLRRDKVASRTIRVVLGTMERFRMPDEHPPERDFLAGHRLRSGLE